MRWPAFLLYLPLLGLLSFRAVTSWPRALAFVYGAVTLAAMWRAFRLGKKKDDAHALDLVLAAAGLAGLALLR